MASVWLTVTAWVYLSVCICRAGIICYGPFALVLYWRWGPAIGRTTISPAIKRMTPARRLAVTSVGDGMQIHDGQRPYHGTAGVAASGGAVEPAPAGGLIGSARQPGHRPCQVADRRAHE